MTLLGRGVKLKGNRIEITEPGTYEFRYEGLGSSRVERITDPPNWPDADPIPVDDLTDVDLAPRDERERFRIYELAPCRACGGRPHKPRKTPDGRGAVAGCLDCRNRGTALVLLVTTPTAEGIGVAIATLAEDAHEAGVPPPGPLGVLDGIEARWLALPWGRKS